MPRKTKLQVARDAYEALIASCIAAVQGIAGQSAADAILAPMQTGSAMPFAPDSSAPFDSLDAAGKSDVADSVAADKSGGLSGNELRAKYGVRLSGPARRVLLREHGFGGPQYVARSYDSYRDGDSRAGSKHAREHGSRASAPSEPAEPTAEQLREMQADLRTAGRSVPRKPGRILAAHAAMLAEATA